MAGREREVKVTILGDSSSGQRALSQLDDRATKTGHHFDGLGSKLASFGKVAALGLAGAAVGVGVFLKSSVEAAEESRKVMAQTDAVIKSTGGVARVTAGDVDKLASSLSAMSGVDDEVIAGGQNLLLTFTNVRNEVGKGNDIFNQGTKAALNMSVALGTDMNSASMLVGKALNDPIKGMAALTKSGIQFTDQQKDQVKAMVESGNVLGAQKIILKELETQFGGSAAAAASPMERLKVVIGNLQEEIGARLLPVIAAAASFLADRLPAALDRIGAVAGPVFALVSSGFNAVVQAFKQGGPGVASEAEGFIGVMERIGLAVRAIVDWVVANWPRIQETISAVLATVTEIVTAFVDIVTTIWNNFGEQIVTYIRVAFDAAMQIVGGAMEIIQGIVATVTAIIHGDWSTAWEGIKQILAGAFDTIIGLAQQWDNVMRSLMSVAMEILGSIIRSAFEGIINFVASIPGRILGALGDLGGLLYGAGQDLIWGFVNGIGSMARQLADAAVNVARGAVNAVKRFLGIGSPSKLFEGFGINIGEGLVGGMAASEGGVARAGTSLAAATTPGLGAGGLSAASLANASLGVGGSPVILNIAGSVVTERELVEAVQAGLLQKQRRVPSLGLA